MKSVQDILDTVRARISCNHIPDSELIGYISDLDNSFGNSIFPKLASEVYTVPADTAGFEIDLADVGADDVKKVYVNGKRITKKCSPDDLLDGWYFSGVKLLISPSILSENKQVTVIYHKRNDPLSVEETDLAVPDVYRDLYVYYCMSQVAARNADATSYGNYQNDYNGLLAEVLEVTAKRQLSPNFTK